MPANKRGLSPACCNRLHAACRPSYSLGRPNIVRQSTGDERTAGRSTASKANTVSTLLGIDATSLFKSCTSGVGFLQTQAEG